MSGSGQFCARAAHSDTKQEKRERETERERERDRERARERERDSEREKRQIVEDISTEELQDFEFKVICLQIVSHQLTSLAGQPFKTIRGGKEARKKKSKIKTCNKVGERNAGTFSSRLCVTWSQIKHKFETDRIMFNCRQCLFSKTCR